MVVGFSSTLSDPSRTDARREAILRETSDELIKLGEQLLLFAAKLDKDGNSTAETNELCEIGESLLLQAEKLSGIRQGVDRHVEETRARAARFQKWFRRVLGVLAFACLIALGISTRALYLERTRTKLLERFFFMSADSAIFDPESPPDPQELQGVLKNFEFIEVIARDKPPLDENQPWTNGDPLVSWVASASLRWYCEQEKVRSEVERLQHEAKNEETTPERRERIEQEIQELQGTAEEWRQTAHQRAKQILDREDIFLQNTSQALPRLEPSEFQWLYTYEAMTIPPPPISQKDQAANRAAYQKYLDEIIPILEKAHEWRTPEKRRGALPVEIMIANNLAWHLHEKAEEDPFPEKSRKLETSIQMSQKAAEDALKAYQKYPKRFPPNTVEAIWDTYTHCVEALVTTKPPENLPAEAAEKFKKLSAQSQERREKFRAELKQHNIPIQPHP